MKWGVMLFSLLGVFLIGCTHTDVYDSKPIPKENDYFVSVYLNDQPLFDERDVNASSVRIRKRDSNTFEIVFLLNNNITFNCLPDQENYVEIKFNNETVDRIPVSPSVCGISENRMSFSTNGYNKAYEIYSALIYR